MSTPTSAHSGKKTLASLVFLAVLATAIWCVRWYSLSLSRTPGPQPEPRTELPRHEAPTGTARHELPRTRPQSLESNALPHTTGKPKERTEPEDAAPVPTNELLFALDLGSGNCSLRGVVRDLGSQPVAGALVQIPSCCLGHFVDDGSGEEYYFGTSETVRTDQDGSWEFTGLQHEVDGKSMDGETEGMIPYRHTLRAYLPGKAKVWTESTGIVLAANEVKYIELVLPINGAGQVEGRVLLAGQPVPGSVLRVSGTRGVGDTTVPYDVQTTADAEGHFEMVGLPLGPCNVRVVQVPPDESEDEDHPGAYPSIELDIRGCVTKDITIENTECLGRVVDRTTLDPVSGAMVEIFILDSEGYAVQEHWITTKSDGTYRFRGLMPGAYRVAGTKNIEGNGWNIWLSDFADVSLDSGVKTRQDLFLSKERR